MHKHPPRKDLDFAEKGIDHADSTAGMDVVKELRGWRWWWWCALL
jgi:hypothetical protein